MVKAWTSKDNAWHAWQGTQFMLSHEPSRGLTAHGDVDAAINYLYACGHRDAARELNAAKKKGQ